MAAPKLSTQRGGEGSMMGEEGWRRGAAQMDGEWKFTSNARLFYS